MGDQTDSKALLGTYVCSEVPGEFVWKAGALTKVLILIDVLSFPNVTDCRSVAKAVVEGRWILIEDIDLAPPDVLQVLVPLLESRRLFIPGRAEVQHSLKNGSVSL